jgi:phosphoribosylaminoimidazolecarboxamide formyltransferase/IMP cyclohydrolase
MAAKPLALLSVYDKTGIVELARRLDGLSFAILSTGGTAEALRRAGIPVTDVARHTGHPEILGGRVKTLHPRIHGGLLGDTTKKDHRAEMETAGIEPIGLVVVNLYPFRETAAKPDAPIEELIEMIDIGGPAMIRSGAKNHACVGVVVDPGDYDDVLRELGSGGLRPETRRRLAVKAFAHTAAYDAAIRDTLERRFATPGRDDSPLRTPARNATHETRFPADLRLEFRRALALRYGENPHQSAALYLDVEGGAGTVARARQLQGKELSYNNLLDLDAAWRAVREFAAPAAVIVKHNNPCGVALAATPAAAFEAARRTDPTSAFGGILAFNREVDVAAATAATSLFLECLIAPSIAAAARPILATKTGLRVLEAGTPGAGESGRDLRSISGGLLVQDPDGADTDLSRARVVTRRAPSAEERKALDLAWRVAKHVKSNAIVFARADHTVGIGAGQMSRVDSVRLATMKAQEPTAGCVMASDAFFPFRDGLDEAARAGITAVVQPGGSMRDEEVIAAADEHGLAMIVTGVRHFRH